jgi:hypothetical protein
MVNIYLYIINFNIDNILCIEEFRKNIGLRMKGNCYLLLMILIFMILIFLFLCLIHFFIAILLISWILHLLRYLMKYIDKGEKTFQLIISASLIKLNSYVVGFRFYSNIISSIRGRKFRGKVRKGGDWQFLWNTKEIWFAIFANCLLTFCG